MENSKFAELASKAKSDVGTGYNPTKSEYGFLSTLLCISTMGIVNIGEEVSNLSGDEKKAYDIAYEKEFSKRASDDDDDDD